MAMFSSALFTIPTHLVVLEYDVGSGYGCCSDSFESNSEIEGYEQQRHIDGYVWHCRQRWIFQYDSFQQRNLDALRWYVILLLL